MHLVKKLLLLKERWPPSFLLSPSSLIWEMHLVACRFSNLNGLFFLTRKIPRELSCYNFPKLFSQKLFPKQKVLSEVLVVFVWTEKKIYILSNQSVVNWKSSPTTYKQGKNISDYYILSLDSVLFKCTSILSRTHNCCSELHCFA